METYTLQDLLMAPNLRRLLAPVRESLAPPAEKQKYLELLTTMIEGMSPEAIAQKFQSTFMPAYINLLSISKHFGTAQDKYRLAADCTKSKILREAEFFALVSQVKQGRERQIKPELWLKPWNHALIQDLLSAGCGLIVAMAKIGLMRHIALELALAGYSTMLAASQHVYPLWRQLFSESTGAPLVEILNIENAAGALRLVRALRANRIVCINIEGESGAGGPWAQVRKHPITFLSKQLVTRNGLVRVSLRTGAPVLPLVAVRTERREGELIYGRVFSPERPRAADDDILECNAVQQLFNFVEGVVLKYPSQYESFSNVHRMLSGRERSSKDTEEGSVGPSALPPDEGALSINHERCVVIPHARGLYCVDPVTMYGVRIPPDRTAIIEFLMKGLHADDSCMQLPRRIPDADARCLSQLINRRMIHVSVQHTHA